MKNTIEWRKEQFSVDGKPVSKQEVMLGPNFLLGIAVIISLILGLSLPLPVNFWTVSLRQANQEKIAFPQMKSGQLEP